MISQFHSSNTFSEPAIQAIQDWATQNLINTQEGIVTIDVDDIWNEFNGLKDARVPEGILPLAANTTLQQMKEIIMRSIGTKGFAHSVSTYGTWHLAAPWCEVEVEAIPTWGGCNPSPSDSASSSTNTAVMIGKSYYYVKYDGVWALQEKSTFVLAQWQPGDVKRNACIPDCYDPDAIENQPDDSANYKSFSDDGEAAIYNLNTWGNWWHPFPGNTDFDGSLNNCYKEKDGNGDWRSPDAVAHMFYAKLVLIDENGIDDRDDSAFIIQTSTDKYIKEYADGTGSLHINDWDIGISGYKRVTNDWEMHTMLAPNIELLYPNYDTDWGIGGNDNILPHITKDDYDYFFADLPIPTEPL